MSAALTAATPLDLGSTTTDGSTDEPSAIPASAETTTDDYDPERCVRDDIEAITVACGAWNTASKKLTAADARSTKACHHALGEIFARSGPTDEDEEKKKILVATVREHPEVFDSTHYNPSNQGAADLHLTLQFGLRLRKGVKSNWKKSVEAAEIVLANGTIKERSVDAFKEWFPAVGMAGARKIVDEARGKQPEDKVAAVAQMMGTLFQLPMEPDWSSGGQHNLAVLVVRLLDVPPGETMNAEALGLVPDDPVLEFACAAIIRQDKAAEKQFLADAESVLERTDTPAMPLDLLIPKSYRRHFPGQTHYTDEDQRNEFLAERKLEQKRVRKRLRERNAPRPQHELARKGWGKTRLPDDFLRGDGSSPVAEGDAEAAEADKSLLWTSDVASSEPASATDKPANGPACLTPATPPLGSADDDDDDGFDYFARLRENA